MRMMKWLLAAILAFGLGLSAAQAATEQAYDAKSFAAAQQAGKPILVHITASWCPTCAKQRPILDKLSAEPAFDKLAIFKVDFDSQKDVVQAMKARMQSTLVVFHGSTEEGRSTGDTDAASIRALVEKSKG